MKKYILYLLIFCFAPALMFTDAYAETLKTGQKILCGFENGAQSGEEVECDITTQKCLRCKEIKKTKLNIAVTLLTRGFVTKGVQVYKCVGQNSPTPANCELAVNGGLKGDEWTNVFFGLVKKGKEEKQNCIVSNFVVKYSNCYGCTIVQTLTSAFVKAAGRAYEVSKQAANVVLLVCMMIWLAFFALKNVSSFATIEPMKILQEFFTQCFKVILALIIINSGINTIMDYTLVPIMSVGTDIADEISLSTSDGILENSDDSDIEGDGS